MKGAPKGHPRYGGGMQKGQKIKKTLEQEVALKLYKDKIFLEIENFIQAQFIQAKGITAMYQRKKIKDKITGKYEYTGEFIRVTDQNQVHKLLNTKTKEEDYYYITTKDPNIKALEDIFNRAFGKPKEAMELSSPGGSPIPMPVNLIEIIKKVYGKNKTNDLRSE